MSRKPPWTFLGLIIILIPSLLAVEWDANNFPNPTAGQFKECGMETNASICDPDKIFNESQRYLLNSKFNQLESRTRQEEENEFCKRKGITGVMAIAKHFKNGTEQAVKEAANEMLRKWDLDKECQKAIVIVLATDDRKFWVARGDRVPVRGEEFTELFTQQRQSFKDGDYKQGLLNMLQGIQQKVLLKQTATSTTSRPTVASSTPENKQQQQPSFTDDSSSKDVSKSKEPSATESIIGFLIIGFIFIVIIILICCCVISFLCCSCCNNGSSNGQGGVVYSTDPMGGGYCDNGVYYSGGSNPIGFNNSMRNNYNSNTQYDNSNSTSNAGGGTSTGNTCTTSSNDCGSPSTTTDSGGGGSW